MAANLRIGILEPNASWRHFAILQGARDWIFAAKFIRENLVVAASRDSGVYLWNIDRQDYTCIQPSLVRTEHRSRVRTLRFDQSHDVTPN